MHSFITLFIGIRGPARALAMAPKRYFVLAQLPLRVLLATGGHLAVQSASPMRFAFDLPHRLTLGSSRSLRSLWTG